MSYIGRGIDQIDNISTLDNLSFNGSLQTFNLTQNSVAFVPVSADALQIQIDGVIQSGNYTVSGSTVTFDFTPSGSSVCNGIKHFGVGIITSVSDGAVTEAKIGSSAVTQAKIGADAVNGTKIADDSISDEHLDITAITGQTAITSLADTDKFLVSDASDSGNLKYVEKQYLPSGGLVFLGGSDTGSNASQISVDNVFSATYKNYLVMVSKNTPATDNQSLFFKFRDDTPADVTNNYMYNYTGIFADSGNTTQRAQVNQGGVQMTDSGVTNASNKLGLKKTMWVQNPFSSSTFTNFHGTFNYIDASTNNIGGYFGGTHESNSSIRGVTFYSGSGNVNVTVKVYGVVDS